MSAIKSIVARLHRDKRGVPMVEYSILIGLITAAAVRLIAAQSLKIVAAWTTLDTAPKWGKSATTGRESICSMAKICLRIGVQVSAAISNHASVLDAQFRESGKALRIS